MGGARSLALLLLKWRRGNHAALTARGPQGTNIHLATAPMAETTAPPCAPELEEKARAARAAALRLAPTPVEMRNEALRRVAEVLRERQVTIMEANRLDKVRLSRGAPFWLVRRGAPFGWRGHCSAPDHCR